MVDPTNDVFEKLKAKHPSLIDINYNINYYNEKREELLRYKVDEDLYITATMGEVRDIIRKKKKLVSPGLDKLRIDHLQELIGINQEPDPQEAEFSQLLTDLINMILRGDFSSSAVSCIKDNHLIAIFKPNSDDIRPIGMGSSIRKIAATIAFHRTNQLFNSEHFKNLQFALDDVGMERIIHSLKICQQRNPTWDVVKIDADNAFNRVDRIEGLLQIKELFPSVFPLLRDMYLDSSEGWYYGLPDKIKSVSSEVGFHQGDVLATWMFIMTIQPMLKEIRQIISAEYNNDSTLINFYVDDGNLCAPHNIMIRIIDLIDLIGPKYGYYIKKIYIIQII
jgi:hypothetical protein